MGWAKSSIQSVVYKKGMFLYVKRKHASTMLNLITRASFEANEPRASISCNGSLVSRHLTFEKPVDIVYTWVNWTAPNYIAQMRREGILYGGSKEKHMNYEKPSGSTAYEELRYSMSSLLKHGIRGTSFIRKIFVVINPIHGPPSWLNTSHPKIQIVHHSQLIEDVPTNNAWAIQTFIHRIPGLGPWFVALNDDVILNKPLVLDPKKIQCPHKEITFTHCPTLRNTCLMYALEEHFKSRVQKIYAHRKKSTQEYRPDVVLWLEHHNWMVANGHAVYEPTNGWFGNVNTNGWKNEFHWVNKRWREVMSKAKKATWINFQGQGISWEYPENRRVNALFNGWIKANKFDLASSFVRDDFWKRQGDEEAVHIEKKEYLHSSTKQSILSSKQNF